MKNEKEQKPKRLDDKPIEAGEWRLEHGRLRVRNGANTAWREVPETFRFPPEVVRALAPEEERTAKTKAGKK
jgi:hypothetical protein